MGINLSINGSPGPEGRYLSWAPSPCILRVTGTDRVFTRQVDISSNSVPGGGRLVFYETPDGPARNQLTLNVTRLGGGARFWVGGLFGSASSKDRDASIRIALRIGRKSKVLLKVPCMVRVRKDANTLTSAERDRFLRAMSILNNQGNGVFQLFREMHLDSTVNEAHFDMGFLPWHRAYLLDLERELQAIDPSVSLPYWRFDAAAPNVFDPAFVGVANAQGAVQLTQTNPLRFWVTDTAPGINRRPEFNTANQPAQSTVPPPTRAVATEAATLAIGQAAGGRYADFSAMEGNPHGTAHVSFGGMISSIGTAARDPLFFLLHANIDRLWAKWQWLLGRFDGADPASFQAGIRVGHRLPDTMWPWNGVTGGPRPTTAPGGGLSPATAASAPGTTPTVGQMLDFQGRLDNASRLGFDYDDVPYT